MSLMKTNNTEPATHDRMSRRAVHHIAQAPRYGYDCSVTERQVQARSAGATADWSRVTCRRCLALRQAPSPFVTQALAAVSAS